LDTLILGKPETQFSAAEDPDWRVLHERCVELSARSKDLRVATKLCLTALKMDGLPGVGEGLALLKGLLERYWEPVYPKLDP
jgi:type VI secretion system protein ImpA